MGKIKGLGCTFITNSELHDSSKKFIFRNRKDVNIVISLDPAAQWILKATDEVILTQNLHIGNY